ncbi:MAG: cytochrome c3 family protein [Coriobacteriia bacterium]
MYATIEAHGGVVAQEHGIETTNIVPGGSNGLDGALSCVDCHSVHAANTVEPFLRDSGRALAPAAFITSDCLLRNDPNGSAPGAYPEYGAKWCASCHDQRHSDSVMTMNHPVESSLTWGYGDVTSTVLPTSYSYDSLDDPVAVGIGRTNGTYLMAPVDASGDGRVEARRAPMCQQCHEDARTMTEPFQGDYAHRGDPTDPDFNPYFDPAPINPEFLTFPHQTTNEYFLVETGDDLCMNCHGVAELP